MTRKLFTYPNYGTPDGYPEHTAHSGQVVTVFEQLTNEGCDPECEPMYRIKADDGWEGTVNESELTEPMCNPASEKCVTVYGGVVLVDGRLNTMANHPDIDVLAEAMADKVCELYGPTAKLLDLQIAEIVHQLTEDREYHYEDCVIYIGELTDIRKCVPS